MEYDEAGEMEKEPIGMTVYLDADTLRDLRAYQRRITEKAGPDVPAWTIPSLARHCIRKWITTHPYPGVVSGDNAEGEHDGN